MPTWEKSCLSRIKEFSSWFAVSSCRVSGSVVPCVVPGEVSSVDGVFDGGGRDKEVPSG